MNKRYLAIPIIALFLVAITSCAQTKESATKARKNTTPVLLQATKQTTLPGRPETPPSTEYNFLLVWNNPQPPLGFFWYHENTWLPCSISTVKNYKKLVLEEQTVHSRPNYQIAVNSPDKISASDTLTLFPNFGGKHKIPDEINPPKENTIYYKTATDKWKALPIDKMVELPTIAMP